jgi:glycosyltransferase involved in cell wall biosynthesis
MGEATAPDLSIVVPLYNEEDNVAPLFAAILSVVRTLECRTELILVDDGSRDATFDRACALPRLPELPLRIVRFRRNYGQTAAMAAGIEQARGRVIITMDGDLQNDPRDIPQFLAKIEEGFDLVVGWRKDRKDHWSRVWPSKVANWLIGKVTGVPIRDNGCSLKAYRASLIREIPLYAEMHRFIPAMTSLAAPKIAEIEVRHHPRRFGRSKYGFSRIYKVLLDLLTIRTLLSFARHPWAWLGGASALAAAVALASLAAALVAAIDYGYGPSVVWSGIATLAGSLAIFTLVLGFLAQLVWAGRREQLALFYHLAVRRVAPSASG